MKSAAYTLLLKQKFTIFSSPWNFSWAQFRLRSHTLHIQKRKRSKGCKNNCSFYSPKFDSFVTILDHTFNDITFQLSNKRTVLLMLVSYIKCSIYRSFTHKYNYIYICMDMCRIDGTCYIRDTNSDLIFCYLSCIISFWCFFMGTFNSHLYCFSLIVKRYPSKSGPCFGFQVLVGSIYTLSWRKVFPKDS